jgi:hypothetical protein
MKGDKNDRDNDHICDYGNMVKKILKNICWFIFNGVFLFGFYVITGIPFMYTFLAIYNPVLYIICGVIFSCGIQIGVGICCGWKKVFTSSFVGSEE